MTEETESVAVVEPVTVEPEIVTTTEPKQPVVAPVSEKNSITKPKGEEFYLDTDFASIAEALRLPVDAIEFSVEETETEHTLTGVAKSS